MKKRLLAGILTGLLILNLSGCGWVADLLHLDQLMPTTTEPTTEATTAAPTTLPQVTEPPRWTRTSPASWGYPPRGIRSWKTTASPT